MAASYESQMRAALRKAKSEAKQLEHRWNADAKRQQAAAERQAVRDARRSVRKVEAATSAEVRLAGQRLGRQVDAENRKLVRRGQSSLRYSTGERLALDRARGAIEGGPGRAHDVFLCHAWADRNGHAQALYEELTSQSLDVWFSEAQLRAGDSLPRQIDRGIAACSLGLVLVTPAFLMTAQAGGWADKELGALLGTKRVIPVLHEVSFDDLSQVSPLLAQNVGFNTENDGFDDIAAKVADNL